ncbi:MAG: lipoprotein LenA, partial [Leptospiraceae bacterium]|nr:lipoprotein LenA [Leptospiraceae bacterium]
MKIYVFILISSLLFFSCKKKESSETSTSQGPQILGTRYALWNNYLTSTPGAKDSKDRVALVYRFEETTLLDKVEKDGKKYVKLKTVEGKEGFAEEKVYTEAIYVVTTSGLPAFRKPTLTAGTKGNVDAGSYCTAREIQGEWANVNCMVAKANPDGSYEDYYDIWIQVTDPKVTVDPLLNETAGLY